MKEKENLKMKRLIAILMTLCLMCTAAALAGAAEATPVLADMPAVVTVDEGVELTAADFEGSWTPDKVFYGEKYLSLEEAAAAGAVTRPFRIADGKIYMDIPEESGEVQTVEMDITVEANQIQATDGAGLDFVIEKLTDGNIVLSVFVPGEGDTVTCISIFMVPAEEAPAFADMPAVVTVDEGVELTAADFEGSWTPDKVFYGEKYLSLEEAAAAGAVTRPFRIADGKIYMDIPEESGEVQTVEMDITVEANQIQATDGAGLDFVIEKLTDGNIVLSVFVPGEGDTVTCISIFMVPAEA